MTPTPMPTDEAVIAQIDEAMRDVAAPLPNLVPAATRQGRRLRSRRRIVGATAGIAVAAMAATAVVDAGSLSGSHRLAPTQGSTSVNQDDTFTPDHNGGLTIRETLDVLRALAPQLNAATPWQESGRIHADASDRQWVAISGTSDNDGLNGFSMYVEARADVHRAKCPTGDWPSMSCETKELDDGSLLALSTRGENGFLVHEAVLIRPDGTRIVASSQNIPASIDGVEGSVPTAPTAEWPLYTTGELEDIVTAPEWTAALAN